jgi:Arc/MetJ-type ribon-helix-helix transcriptional regulator
VPGDTADEYDTAGEDGPRRAECGEDHRDGGAEDGLQHREHDHADQNPEGPECPTLGSHRPAVARYRQGATLISRFAVCHATPTHRRNRQVRFPVTGRDGAGNQGFRPMSPEAADMPDVEVSLPDRIDSEIDRLIEQGEFLNREQAVEELLSMGVSAYAPTEEDDEEEKLFTQMTDDQQDPAARQDDEGDEYTL